MESLDVSMKKCSYEDDTLKMVLYFWLVLKQFQNLAVSSPVLFEKAKLSASTDT